MDPSTAGSQRPPGARLALGTAQLGGAYGIANRLGRPSPEDGERILEVALALGVRCLDTAPDYGESETVIGRFLRRNGRRDDVAVCTKLPRLESGLAACELEQAVVAQVDGSRRRLGAARLDYYLIHSPRTLREHGPALVDALVRRREADQVGRIGVSVYDPAEAELTLAYPELGAIQFPFNLFDRRIDSCGCTERLRAAGHATFARSPLLQGLLALSPHALPQRVVAARPWLVALRDLLREHGAEPVPTALAYAVARSGADRVVLGVESPAQLESAVEAVRGALTPGLLGEIDRRFAALPADVIDPRRWGR